MVEYIDREELKELLETNNKSFLVVDCRDDDFEGGAIPTAINVPSLTFDSKNTLEKLHAEVTSNDINQIIFHCFKSQFRGPSCAQTYFGYLVDNQINVDDMKIQVLTSGFEMWKHEYSDDPKLINYDLSSVDSIPS